MDFQQLLFGTGLILALPHSCARRCFAHAVAFLGSQLARLRVPAVSLDTLIQYLPYPPGGAGLPQASASPALFKPLLPRGSRVDSRVPTHSVSLPVTGSLGV